MASFDDGLTRRGFLGAAALAAGCSAWNPEEEAKPQLAMKAEGDKPAKKIAVITTAYHYLSHAYHICGRFLYGYLRNGKLHKPGFKIAGMHVEQVKDNDLSRELAKKHGFKLYPDIAGALTLGGNALAVDGVLLIGEHG